MLYYTSWKSIYFGGHYEDIMFQVLTLEASTHKPTKRLHHHATRHGKKHIEASYYHDIVNTHHFSTIDNDKYL